MGHVTLCVLSSCCQKSNIQRLIRKRQYVLGIIWCFSTLRSFLRSFWGQNWSCPFLMPILSWETWKLVGRCRVMTDWVRILWIWYDDCVWISRSRDLPQVDRTCGQCRQIWRRARLHEVKCHSTRTRWHRPSTQRRRGMSWQRMSWHHQEQDDEAEGGDLQSMVLLPPSIKTEIHNLEVSVYRAENLPKMDKCM